MTINFLLEMYCNVPEVSKYVNCSRVKIFFIFLRIIPYFWADDSAKTIINIQDLFKIRSRMLEVKTNYKGNYKEYNCDECKIIGLKN